MPASFVTPGGRGLVRSVSSRFTRSFRGGLANVWSCCTAEWATKIGEIAWCNQSPNSFKMTSSDWAPFMFAWAKAARASTRSIRSSRASRSRRSSMGTTAATARPRRRNRTRSLPNAARLIASTNPSRSLFPAGFPIAHPINSIRSGGQTVRTVQAVQWVGGKVNRREHFICPFHFFRNWGMKWGRRLRRSAILLIHTQEETLNG